MTTAPHTATATVEKSTRGTWLAAILIGLIAASTMPLLLLIVPSIRSIPSMVFGGFEPPHVSYDPASALEPLYATGKGSSRNFAITVFQLMFFTIVGIAVPLFMAAILHKFVTKLAFRNAKDRANITEWSCWLGTVLGLVATLIVAVITYPPSAYAKVEAEEPAHVAAWVEGRYSLTVDESDAKALTEQARAGDGEGDPVLIDGHLLNLTPIAQGGYVLTDDKSATELPTKN